MPNKKMYLVLDTETLGGTASNYAPTYHIGGVVRDRQGNIFHRFNFVIDEHLDLSSAFYGKGKFDTYADMIISGTVQHVPTEHMAKGLLTHILHMYDITTLCAYNSGFDFMKTFCNDLTVDMEIIDLWLASLQTICKKKSYLDFCREHGLKSSSKKSVSTTAEAVYAYLINNPAYVEEHTALEDSEIESVILSAVLDTHKPFTRNVHCFDYPAKFGLFTPFIPKD